MPPTTLCTTCLRLSRQTTITSRITSAHQLRNHSTTPSRICPSTLHRPLHLDFLAPWTLRTNLPLSYRTKYVYHSSRTYSTTPPPSNTATAILNPRTTPSGTQMTISITPRATSRLSKISASDNNPGTALRITVESGGCHGFQYLMSLTDLNTSPPGEDDTVFEGDEGAKVVIDESSLELLNGSTVDYTMELIGSQFKVTGIPGATSSCGCGTSFDIKL